MSELKDQSVQKEETPTRRLTRRHGFWSGLFLGGLLAALVGLALSRPTLYAAGRWLGGHGYSHRWFDDPDLRRERVEFAVDWMAKKLEATDEQRERIKVVVSESMDNIAGLAEQHRANRQAFVAELTTPTIDRAALEQLRASELKLADEASRRLVTALADVAETLTPEQRAKVLEHLERHRR